MKKCARRYCELASKNVEQLQKGLHAVYRRPSAQNGRDDIGGRTVKSLLPCRPDMPLLGAHRQTRQPVVCEQTCQNSHEVDKRACDGTPRHRWRPIVCAVKIFPGRTTMQLLQTGTSLTTSWPYHLHVYVQRHRPEPEEQRGDNADKVRYVYLNMPKTFLLGDMSRTWMRRKVVFGSLERT